LEFERGRFPYTDKEEEICGTEIPIPSIYMCGECGETFLNLEATDPPFCLNPRDDMRECLKEYWHLTGFTPRKED
jgi:hypothetical protein